MRIGIWIRDPESIDGGASIFADSILNDVEKISHDYNVIFCHKGSFFSKVIEKKHGRTYLNVSAFIAKNYVHLATKRAVLHMKALKYYFTFRPMPKCEVSFWDLIAKRYNIDIFWFTYPVIQTLSTPYIYTLWDLGHRTVSYFPEVSKPIEQWNARELMYKETLYRATYILIGNATGKKEVVENYSISPDKVKVIPFPISNFCFGKERELENKIDYEYFFYPAQIIPHKNHTVIIQALNVLENKYGLTPHVVFTGKHTDNLDYIMDLANKLNVKNRVHRIGYVSNEELKYLYTHAIAMLFPSMMGPNNLPPLEAAYLGCPVILSDIEGHREQMQDGAVYFDPLNPEDLAEKMKNTIENPQLRQELIESGKKLMDEYKNYKYVDGVLEILAQFSIIRKRWR